jgi:glycosyltransferase involved in cell wall biosynthesis
MRSICFFMRFHPNYQLGGAEIQAYLLASELARRGWNVHYLSECKYPSPQIIKENSGLFIHQLPLRHRDFTILFFRQYIKKLAEIDADIIYQRIALPHSSIAAHYSRTHSKLFVWGCAHTEDCSGEKYIQQIRQDPFRVSWLRAVPFALLNDRLVRYGLRNADARVVQSMDQRLLLSNYLGLTSIVIPNGHPVPGNIITKDNPPLILWVANLTSKKNPEMFIKLAHSCSDLSAQFVMIGHPTDESLLRQVMIKSNGLNNFRYFGKLSFDETELLIGKARILVNTSQSEGFPNTFIQSWFRETPVVSLHVDPDGVIEREQIGRCSGSLNQLELDVRQLLMDDHLCREMGKNASKYAQSKYRLGDVVDQYQELFEGLIQGDHDQKIK